MLDKAFYVITFESTHLAISTEREVLKHIKVEMVPTPREITASCGLSIKIGLDQLEQVLDVLSEKEKTGMKLYKLVREASGKVVTPIEWRE